MSLKENIDQFADRLIKDCLQDKEKPIAFQEKLDCFKAVATYYGILAKHKGDVPAETEGATFDTFRDSLKEQDSGGSPDSPVHARRRPAGDGICIDGEVIGGPKLLRNQPRN